MSIGGPARDAAYSALQVKNSAAIERLTALDVSAGRVNTSQLYIQGVPLDEYICAVVESGNCLIPNDSPPEADENPEQDQEQEPLQYSMSGPAQVRSHTKSKQDSHSTATSIATAASSSSSTTDPVVVFTTTAAHKSEEESDHNTNNTSGTVTPFLDSNHKLLQNVELHLGDQSRHESQLLSAAPTPVAGHSSPYSKAKFAEVAARSAHAHVADIAHGYHDPVNGQKGYVLTSDEFGQASWQSLPLAPVATGDVEGPLQSKVDSIAIFDSTNGRLLRDSDATMVGDTLCVPRLETRAIVLRQGSNDLDAPEGSLLAKGPDNQLVWISAPKTMQHDKKQEEQVAWRKDAETGHVTIAHLHLENTFAPKDTPANSIPVADSTGELNWKPIGDALRGSSMDFRNMSATQTVVETAVAKQTITDDLSARNAAFVELMLPNDAVTGHVLTCDEHGKAKWQPVPAPVLPPPPTVPELPKNLVCYQQDPPSNSSSMVMTIPCMEEQSCDDDAKIRLYPSHVTLDCQSKVLHSLMMQTTNLQSDTILAKSVTSGSLTASSLTADKMAVDSLWNSEGTPWLSLPGICQGAEHAGVALGWHSQKDHQDGRGNVSVGNFTLVSNKTGHYNTAVGDKALKDCVNAHGNTAIGAGALVACRTGGHNTAIGTGAGEHVVHGSGNTIIGDGAGPVADLHHSICIGRGAKAQTNGDVALGSNEAPVRITKTATPGELCVLNPAAYLNVTLNGIPFKLALYHP